jgi:hypothetical protein
VESKSPSQFDFESALLAIIAGFAAVFFLQTFTYRGTITGMFPRVLSAVVLVLIAGFAAAKLPIFRRRISSATVGTAVPECGAVDGSGLTPAARPVMRWEISLAWMLAYAALLYLVGFWVSSFLYALLLARQLKNRNLKVTVTFAALTAAVLFAAFTTLFYVPLPEGLIFELLRDRL